MSEQSAQHPESEVDDTEQNAGDRAADLTANPSRSLDEARNAAEGKSPNAAGSISPSTAEDAVPSNSSPESSNLPSSNNPNPD
jgi:hypothetical protein